jgi:hypothetical protein
VVLTIDSYNDGEFDPSVPHDEPDNPEPPPTEEDRQLTSRAPGSESAVIDAAQQRNNPTARSQRAAERAEATNARRSPESTSPAPAASAPASTDAPATAASRGSPRPAEPPTTPMETDEPHAAPRPAAATSGEGGAEGAAPSRAPVPDEDVTESDLFSEESEQEEGGGTLSSYHSGPNP